MSGAARLAAVAAAAARAAPGAPLRRSIHRGSVLAHGVCFDLRRLGEETARERVLRLRVPGIEVHRCGEFLAASFAQPTRMLAGTAPGGLLVRQGKCLSAAPLAKDELARVDVLDASVLLVVAGTPRLHSIGDDTREDPATWLDVSDFALGPAPEPLGIVVQSAAAATAPADIDVRASLGVAPAAAGALELIDALAAAERAGRRRRLAGLGGAGAIFRFVQGIAHLIGRLLGPRAGAGQSGSGGVRGGESRTLTVHDELRPAGPSWLSALSRRLRTWSMQVLLRTRLAQYVGRRQAEYLSRMIDMFDRGDLDEALRHAIALGGDGGAEPPAPAMGTPSPRADLAIVPSRAAAASAIFGGAELQAELQRRYRRAFDQLVLAGEIEKAAFVLAELLKANEEAVSFLEKHRRFRLAAEIAEARRLAPGLIVRQWFLAGEHARAVRLARSTGAFADAVHRLEAHGDAQEALALRLAWADSLASSGDYAAAIATVWPVVAARALALAWFDRVLALGGAVAARMAIRKLSLLPDAFEEVRELTLAALREPGEDGLIQARALAAEILEHPATATLEALARPVLRALLGSSEPADGPLAERLLKVSGDALLAADVRLLWRRSQLGRGAVEVSVVAMTHLGRSRSHNEDACLATLLAAAAGPVLDPQAEQARQGDAAREGLVLGAFDGTGGMAAGDVASRLVAITIAARLGSVFPRAENAAAWGEAVREAVSFANSVLWQRARKDVRFRGAGSTAVVASPFGGTLFVAHVGDSRAYLRRAGQLVALTRDHSLVNEHIAAGGLATQEEIDAFPHKTVLTRALGLTESVVVDVLSIELCDGDVVLLCSDGLWSTLAHEAIAAELAEPNRTVRQRAEALQRKALAAEGHDDVSLAIATFKGKHLPRGNKVPVAVTAVVPGAGAAPAVRVGPHSTPLLERTEPLSFHRPAADTGALAILDAAELRDGRLLLALGELGAWLVSREGRILARFSEPAHALVLSDHGDRALLVAPRGESLRVARLDLARKRQQPWCDVQVDAFARDFDGSVWFVARGSTLHAIDALSQGWEHLWELSEQGSRVTAVARNEARLSAVIELAAENSEVWTFDLPSYRLCGRTQLSRGRGPFRAGAVSPGGLVVGGDGKSGEALEIHLRTGATTRPVPHQGAPGSDGPWLDETWLVAVEKSDSGPVAHLLDTARLGTRVSVGLEGRGVRVGARLGRERVLLFDDRGRLLVISLQSGSVLRELRLS